MVVLAVDIDQPLADLRQGREHGNPPVEPCNAASPGRHVARDDEQSIFGLGAGFRQRLRQLGIVLDSASGSSWNTPCRRAAAAPARTMPASARPPSSRPSASMITLLPAPVS